MSVEWVSINPRRSLKVSINSLFMYRFQQSKRVEIHFVDYFNIIHLMHSTEEKEKNDSILQVYISVQIELILIHFREFHI